MITAAAGSVLAFSLGLRHGLDADHLAAIDGLTRWNTSKQRPFAPYCGALFAVGHAGVIFAAAVGLAILTSQLASQWAPPAWLGPAGVFISAVTLLLLSAINLHIAFGTPGNRHGRLVGLRSMAFATLLRAPRAWQVMLLGGLFALSFDAIALATLFATSASPSGNVIGAGQLALLFGLGMVAVGTANGRWVMHLLRQSNDSSRHASRVMTITIALTGFLVGTCVLLTQAVEPFERWVATHEFVLSGFVMTTVLAGYACVLTLAYRARRYENRTAAT